jgi:hypothetical protein
MAAAAAKWRHEKWRKRRGAAYAAAIMANQRQAKMNENNRESENGENQCGSENEWRRGVSMKGGISAKASKAK